MAEQAGRYSDLPYRVAMRDKFPKRYNGIVHFVLGNLIVYTLIAGAAFMMTAVHPLEWLTIPTAFLFANIVEWMVHKGPLHNKRPYMEIVFDRHTLSHHEYFRDDSMPADSHREWYYVLFPVWGSVAVFLPALPICLGAWFLISPNVALLFFATAMAYYIFYEWMHLAYHLPEDHWFINNAPMRFLQKHHRYHHNKRLMQKYNFNVTFPIGDWLFGTMYHPVEEEGTSPDGATKQI